ncbi:MAG: DUF4115 domain-containing protein [Candidatus Accumulibacter sp.]|jgi:cytoskeleton protein RodZ|nr:DUF4115 domain-containing protein [Accumulibacter sp.]
MSHDDDRTDEWLCSASCEESSSEREAEGAAPSFVSPSVGSKLRAARLARGLTIGDIAKALKLSASQVDALEVDDWRHLPGNNTIIRGFVRNYARFLDMGDIAELMGLLDVLHIREARELEIPEGMNVGVSSGKRFWFRDYLHIIFGLIVLVASILLYFLLPDSSWQTMLSSFRSVLPTGMKSNVSDTEDRKTLALSVTAVPDTAARATPVPLSPQPLLSPQISSPAQILPKPMPETSETPSVIQPVTPSATLAADVPAKEERPGTTPQAPMPSASGNGLTLNFLGGAWVEVRNRDNKVVFSQMNSAGTQQRIEIQPPFFLIVGNSANVRAHYKGKPLDLSRRSRENVARVTVR